MFSHIPLDKLLVAPSLTRKTASYEKSTSSRTLFVNSVKIVHFYRCDLWILQKQMAASMGPGSNKVSQMLVIKISKCLLIVCSCLMGIRDSIKGKFKDIATA